MRRPDRLASGGESPDNRQQAVEERARPVRVKWQCPHYSAAHKYRDRSKTSHEQDGGTMSSSSDIEKLFDHFGGDANAYQEIGRENEARSARTRWPLLVTLDLTALCCVATASPDALAQASKDPLSVLIDQGKYWQSHQRGDLAEQAWQKVLRIDPKQPDALTVWAWCSPTARTARARSSTSRA
ncbi:MAG: cellulose synthase operon protein [Paraburkholderia sp.]|jgi:hypothetical protein|nr:cellulose synthase operon protein [Paraburkholderia sp.]